MAHDNQAKNPDLGAAKAFEKIMGTITVGLIFGHWGNWRQATTLRQDLVHGFKTAPQLRASAAVPAGVGERRAESGERRAESGERL